MKRTQKQYQLQRATQAMQATARNASYPNNTRNAAQCKRCELATSTKREFIPAGSPHLPHEYALLPTARIVALQTV